LKVQIPATKPKQNPVLMNRALLWLGLVDLFQTIDELNEVNDIASEIKEIRDLLDEEQGNE